jgi:DNA-binding transcriptional LysR family regulator
MSFLNLDLNLLRVFDSVMSEQNLTRAADGLAMTQPAVSNALKRLRVTLHDELLIRTARGVKPTPRAEALWPSVRSALSCLEMAIAPKGFPVAETKASYRLMMADTAASLLLPPLMNAASREAPGLNVRVLPLTTRDPRPMLVQSNIDLAIGSFPGVVGQLTAGHDDFSPIRHQRLYSGEYLCIMRKSHPLAHEQLTVERYCNARHVLMSVSGRAQGLADAALEKLGTSRRVVLTVNQFFTVGLIVAQSDLISIVPRDVIEWIGMADALVSKELPFELPKVHLDMLWHNRDLRSPAHEWMRKKLGTMLSDQLRHLVA